MPKTAASVVPEYNSTELCPLTLRSDHLQLKCFKTCLASQGNTDQQWWPVMIDSLTCSLKCISSVDKQWKWSKRNSQFFLFVAQVNAVDEPWHFGPVSAGLMFKLIDPAVHKGQRSVSVHEVVCHTKQSRQWRCRGRSGGWICQGVCFFFLVFLKKKKKIFCFDQYSFHDLSQT